MMRKMIGANSLAAVVACGCLCLPVHAQAVAEREIFDGVKFGEGFDMGVDSSRQQRAWVTPEDGSMKMAYPAGQAWGAVFVTVGKSKDPPRPLVDLSGYSTLLVELRGDPGTTVAVGIKDATQPDDGNEQKVILPVYQTFRTYAIPLTAFNRADLKRIYVPCEFVFEGAQAQNVWFRRIRYSTAPAPVPESIVHGASFRPGAAAGTWATIFGKDLSTVSRGWADRDFQGKKLPTALDGVSVHFNDRAMSPAYISPTQINALIFHDVPTGQSAYISVTNAVGTSVPIRVVPTATYPAFFALSPQSSRYAAAVHPDGVIVGRAGLYGTAVTTRPARPGDVVQIFGTGFGSTNPATVADEIVSAPAPLPSSAGLSVRFGTTPATVEFAGLVGPGLYQFNVRVPNVADGDQRLFVDLGSVAMQQEIYLTVQR